MASGNGPETSADLAGWLPHDDGAREFGVSMPTTASQVIDALWAVRSADERAKVRKQLADDEEAFGLRMRDLFDLAKQATDLPLSEVHQLLDHPAYEPRMAAMCILDLRARSRLAHPERQTLAEVSLDRHDRITTWDMVDRAAPRVVGGALADDLDPTVSKPVGIFLKHASTRDPEGAQRFLDQQAAVMPRPTVRLATEKLDDDLRQRYLA